MFIGGRVYAVAATVTNAKKSAATIRRVDATCGAAIVDVNGWGCSRNGVKHTKAESNIFFPHLNYVFTSLSH
jgi:hypothetical protein